MSTTLIFIILVCAFCVSVIYLIADQNERIEELKQISTNLAEQLAEHRHNIEDEPLDYVPLSEPAPAPYSRLGKQVIDPRIERIENLRDAIIRYCDTVTEQDRYLNKEEIQTCWDSIAHMTIETFLPLSSHEVHLYWINQKFDGNI